MEKRKTYFAQRWKYLTMRKQNYRSKNKERENEKEVMTVMMKSCCMPEDFIDRNWTHTHSIFSQRWRNRLKMKF